jgi:hypothetical protein
MKKALPQVLKILGLLALCLFGGVVGASLATHFGTSSYSISFVDFISVMLTALGVMMTTMTLLVGALAVIGWTSIEGKLRDHSYDYMSNDLKVGGPLQELVRRAVRDAVYEGVRPLDHDIDYSDDAASGAGND